MALASQRQSPTGFDSLPPELQQNIFNYLVRDKTSLFAAIRVSRACYNCCIGMLWRESTQKGLAKARTPERRQHYANMICDWCLDDDPLWKLFDGLEFPLLRGMTFSGGSLSVAQLRRCLQGLHTIQYTRCELDTAILEMIATCCTQLQELVITSPDTSGITPSHFVTFLQSFSSLRRLHLYYIPSDALHAVVMWKGKLLAQLEELTLTEGRKSGPVGRHNPWLINDFLKRCTSLRKLCLDRGDLLYTETIASLSCSQSLKVLHVDGRLDMVSNGQLLEHYFNDTSVSHPFPSIKDFSLTGKPSVLANILFTRLDTLVDLHLEITESDKYGNLCSTIGCLSSLVRLSLLFGYGCKVFRVNMDCVSRLSNLQKCHIVRQESWVLDELLEPYPSEYSWLTDQYFKDWIAKFPQLRDLRLAIGGVAFASATQACLQSLADSCPLLTDCRLIWEHDLSTWISFETSSFPNLEVLHLGRVKKRGRKRGHAAIEQVAARDIEVIRKLAPNLRAFTVESKRKHEVALMATFRSGV